VQHLEPVQGYTLLHEDNEDIHALHAAGKLDPADHAFHSRNAVRSLAAHSLQERTFQGLDQPFPPAVSLSFHVWGQLIHLPHMKLSTGLFGEYSYTVIEDAAANTTRKIPNVLQSYVYHSSDRTLEATATLQRDGHFQALVNTFDAEGSHLESIQIEPLFMHKPHMAMEMYDRLDAEAPHGMVAFKHSEFTEQTLNQQCGAAVRPPADDPFAEPKMHVEKAPTAASLLGTEARRRLMATIPIGMGVTRWVNCYPGDTTTHRLSVGVAADVGFYQQYNDAMMVQAVIAAIYMNINLVYTANFNVFLQINDVLIQSTEGGLSWNLKPATPGAHCTTTINSDLDLFTAWRKSAQPKRNGQWHLLTNCYPPAGIVSLRRTLCFFCASSRFISLARFCPSFPVCPGRSGVDCCRLPSLRHWCQQSEQQLLGHCGP
jgi:hypothetical protein